MSRANGATRGQSLAAELRIAGADQAWASRLADELDDHRDELIRAARRQGYTLAEAKSLADTELGSKDVLMAAYWHHHGATERVIPRLAGWGGGAMAIAGQAGVLRWATAGLLGSAATLATLFFMQLAIYSGL